MYIDRATGLQSLGQGRLRAVRSNGGIEPGFSLVSCWHDRCRLRNRFWWSRGRFAQTAFLVFLAAATGAGIISTGCHVSCLMVCLLAPPRPVPL